MPRQDLITAIKNALDRGQNIEMAKQTLINSGYPKQDVEEAGSFFKHGTLANVPNITFTNKKPEKINQKKITLKTKDAIATCLASLGGVVIF